MKKVLLLTLTFCIFSVVHVAQNKNAVIQKQLDIKNKQTALEKKNTQNITQLVDDKPFDGSMIGSVTVGSKEYDELKSKGLLNRYEIKIDANQAQQVSIQNLSQNTGNKTTANTPCDTPPVTGINPWGTTLTDDATSLIALPFNFCFYGVTYNACRVGTNGNLQFGTSNSAAFSSVGFPTNTVKMIAPFWSDLHVNVLSGGLRYGKVYVDVYPTRLVVSWDSSAYFNQHVDKLNSFQCVITDGTDPLLPPGKNVGFYYRSMQWTTGDASGGTGGFPTTQPGTPATVGANEGNGTDYFLIGRFGIPGSAYDGPLGGNDGISWLDGKKFFFNVCPPVGGNQEPVSTIIQVCDSFRVCGNDTLYIKNTFIAPEVTQTNSITASAPSLGASFSYSNVSTGNSSDIYMIIDGSTAPAGYHTITMTATDNGTPVQTSVQTFVVYVDNTSLNNLNGVISINPNFGACPGGVVTASVTVSGGAPDTYLWSNNSTATSTSFTIAAAADSLIFVTLTSGQCKKTILGDINVNPIPVASISGILDYCSTSMNTVLTATNTLNPSTQGPHTYTWTGSGTIGSSNTATTTLTAGLYTVTVANQFGCLSTAATTVVVNEGPSYSVSTNATSGGTLYCATLDTARIAFHYAAASTGVCGLATTGCISSNNINVGNGTTSTSGTGTTPFANLWGNTRHQYLITAAELTAGGAVAGKLSSISFSIATVTGLNNYPNFTINLKCTNAAALTTTFDNFSLVEVYSANTPITVGLNTFNFSQSYIWDGTSNLLVDVCHDLALPWTNSSAVYSEVTPFTSVTYDFDDATPLCGSTTPGTTTNNRPNMIFGNCLAQQLPSQFDVTVTPTLGVVIPAGKDSVKIDLPPGGTTQCYTITVSNPVGGCFKDTVICIFSDQGTTNATFIANTPSVCVGAPVTLTANGATTYTIYYIQAGVPVSLTNSTTITHVPVQQGLNVYSLTAVGNCGAAPVGYTVGVIVVPIADLVISPLQDMTKCMNRDYIITTGVNSTNANPGTPYTYNWTTLPGNIPASGNNSSSSYTYSANSTTTLVVTVNGVCANGTQDTVVIKNFADDLAISIIDSSTVCANTAFTLNTLVTGGYPNYNYSWYIDGNSNVISNSPNLAYVSPSTQGNYVVSVYVNDSCGYNKGAFETIVVLPPCAIEIPNIITPNGDGVNEIFVIKNIEHHPNTVVTIFDRWGRKIYENSNYNNEWKAENASDGTYFYVIDVPEDKKYNGFITIFKGK